MLILVKLADAWALDWSETPVARTITKLFGGTVVELPLSPSLTREHALDFARNTVAGEQYGVRS